MKGPGIIELASAGIFGLGGLVCFALMQVRQPYPLSQIRFCPQSANHPLVLDENIERLNRDRTLKKEKDFLGNPKNKKATKLEDFDKEGQERLDEKYCHQPRFILTEEWERYGKFGSKIPYKGDAISLVGDATEQSSSYIYFNLGASLSLWGVTSCVLYRVSKLKKRDYEFSEEEKNIGYQIWLEESNKRNLAQFSTELDAEITKEMRDFKHQILREELGLADTENEAIKNKLQLESALLGREAEHAEFRKKIAERNRDATKADVERNNLLKKITTENSEVQTATKTTTTSISQQGNDIVIAIASFGLELEYIGAFTAPAIVRHRFKFINGKKSKISDLQTLADDLALNMGLTDTPRIVRDKGEIIVEVPREDREFPHINDALKLLKKPEGDSVILIGGIDYNGKLMQLNVLESPDCHGFGAGATKSGKTQGIYAQIAALITMYSPIEVKLAIYDGKSSLILPKELEPWLFCETAIAGQGGEYIQLLEAERSRRIDIREGYRDVTEFNQETSEERLPYIIAIMDEYSVDREAFEGKKSEPDSNMMKNLGKLARSEGIHLYLFDQSAKGENISNRVKENLGFRTIYRMVDKKSSSYLEVDGAHQLLGKGDVIVRWESRQYRCQMPNCSPQDLAAIVKQRAKELNLNDESAAPIKLETEKGAVWDWYEALQNWALDSDPTPDRDRIQSEWVRLSGTEPNKEQLDIFMENLAALL